MKKKSSFSDFVSSCEPIIESICQQHSSSGRMANDILSKKVVINWESQKSICHLGIQVGVVVGNANQMA